MKADERAQQVSGYSAVIILGLTQVALGCMIGFRAYVLNQPDEQFIDLQILFFASLVGYFGLRSWLGGYFPVLSKKQALLAYLGLFAFLFVTLSLWFGLPSLSEFQNTYLPVIIGPAIVVGGYWLIAWIGHWRIEKIGED